MNRLFTRFHFWRSAIPVVGGGLLAFQLGLSPSSGSFSSPQMSFVSSGLLPSWFPQSPSPRSDHSPSCCYDRLSKAAETTSPSVVSIRTEIDITVKSGLFGHEEKLSVARGSGFFINSQGLICTNAHVIEDVVDGGRLFIETHDGQIHHGRVFATDHWSDFALIQLVPSSKAAHTQSWLPVEFASTPSSLQLGQLLFTYGDPLGLGHTLTCGIVSALNRRNVDVEMSGRMDSRIRYIQTNFTGFDFGNSGGAVFDLDGRVVGINVIKSDTAGISFAVSIDSARPIIDQLLESGKVRRQWLGIKLVSLNSSVLQQLIEYVGVAVNESPSSLKSWSDWLNITRGDPTSADSDAQNEFMKKVPKLIEMGVGSGALILSIFEKSPAERAKCKIGDIIVSVNSIPVKSSSEVFATIGYNKLDEITVEVKRLSQNMENVETHILKLKPEELDLFIGATHPLNTGDSRVFMEYVEQLDKERRAKLQFLK